MVWKQSGASIAHAGRSLTIREASVRRPPDDRGGGNPLGAIVFPDSAAGRAVHIRLTGGTLLVHIRYTQRGRPVAGRCLTPAMLLRWIKIAAAFAG
jgi:hypothetical protein